MTFVPNTCTRESRLFLATWRQAPHLAHGRFHRLSELPTFPLANHLLTAAEFAAPIEPATRMSQPDHWLRHSHAWHAPGQTVLNSRLFVTICGTRRFQPLPPIFNATPQARLACCCGLSRNQAGQIKPFPTLFDRRRHAPRASTACPLPPVRSGQVASTAPCLSRTVQSTGMTRPVPWANEVLH